jgi:NADH-quinone oxidoreductase subunit N
MPDFTELRLLAPELVLSCGFLLLLVLGLFRSLSLNWLLTCASLVVVADAVAVILIAPGFSKSDGGRMLMDGVFMSFNFGRLILSVAAMGTLLMVRSASLLRHRGEFFALLLGLLLGGQLLIISSHAVMILLAIELMSLSSYVLAGYLFQREGVSASVTYFIYGSIATAVMCFGFALMYSSGGVLQTDAIADTIRFGHIPDSRWLAGLLMVLAAVMFKLAAAPQHLWAPDVYAAAPTPVLAAFSTIPKVAAMLFLARLPDGGPWQPCSPVPPYLQVIFLR